MIQPLSPPDLVPPNTALPTFRVFTAQIPKIPKPFIVPGRRTPTPPDPAPPPPPPPTIELANAPPADNPLRSALVLPPAPPPVIEDQPPKLSTAQPPSRVGDPANILSLSDRPVPPSDKLVVPPGNVLGATGDGMVLRTGTADGDPGGAAGSKSGDRKGNRAPVRWHPPGHPPEPPPPPAQVVAGERRRRQELRRARLRAEARELPATPPAELRSPGGAFRPAAPSPRAVCSADRPTETSMRWWCSLPRAIPSPKARNCSRGGRFTPSTWRWEPLRIGRCIFAYREKKRRHLPATW